MDADELIARAQIAELVAAYNHLGDRGRIDVGNVEEFLKAMAMALRKLEKPAKSG